MSMSPKAQVRLGKAMQLLGIFGLIAMLVLTFSVSTDFVQGQDIAAAPWGALILIYAMGLSALGRGQVQKGRQRQAKAKKTEDSPAVEQGPLVCRTGGEHIYLGNDTGCLNACGIARDQTHDRPNLT